MPTGIIYFSDVHISYRSGRANARKTTSISTPCVGYSGNDALDRLKKDPKKIEHRLKHLGKIRDVSVISLDALLVLGRTVYDLETGEAIDSQIKNPNS
jgi:hypothetical protein